MNQLKTFIINLKERKDRRESVLKEFSNRKEFAIQIVEAIKHNVGAVGLWQTIRNILKDLNGHESDFILICEDDHQFTTDFSYQNLFTAIAEAGEKEADILCGGVSWFNNAVPVSNNLYWVEKFSGLQFTVIFKKFFRIILNATFNEFEAADYKISDLTVNKFFIFPFISTQKDFGYSDVTPKNNVPGRVSQLFDECIERVSVLNKITRHYQNIRSNTLDICMDEYKDVVIPAYIIHLSERVERKVHIEEQFLNRNEFELIFIEGYKHKIGAVGLWLSIRKIVEISIKNDDDIIIVCEDDHQFTEYYSKQLLIKTILEAGARNADMLIGGVVDSKLSVPIANELFWVGEFNSTQFLVLFKNVYKKIIDEPFDEKVTADGKLSEIAGNKLLFYPFISIQREFGYSDISPVNNNIREQLPNEKKFEMATNRLKKINDIKNTWGLRKNI